ncbi:hypothetical protein [Elizabethkingia miricola]|uniref:hypothetical protein n=1 Tax=Elizabethkingia miricola TaxID=172045 RepID=UPI00389206AA
MGKSIFKVEDVANLNSNPKVKMHVSNVVSNELIKVSYEKPGLAKASPDFITKLFELREK